MRFVSKVGIAVLTLSCLSSVVGADSNSNVADYFEDASKLYYQDELVSAVLQLKNALQADSRHLPSLILSGEIYVQQGDAKAAEHVLRQALLFGADSSLVVLNLAKAYLQLGEYQRVISELAVDGLASRIKVDLLGYRAEAYTLLGQLSDARNAIDLALAIDADALLPRLANVILLIREGASERALETAQQLINSWPNDARSWNSHASVVHALGNLDAAINSYDKALEIQPNHSDARVAKVGALIDLERLDEAGVELDFLNTESPYDPRAAYFRGLLLSKNGETEAARLEYVKCTEVVASLPKVKVEADPQFLMVAALAHHALKQREPARTYLEKYLKRIPADVGAYRLLADVLLGLGEPEKVIKVLNNVRSLTESNASLLTMLAAAHSQSGRHDKATRLLEKALGKGGNLFIETQLAKSLLKSGSAEKGVRALEKIFSTKPSQQTAFLLTVSYIKQKQFSKAEMTARKLIEFSPNNATYQNLLGIALLSEGKILEARNQFTTILNKNPDFSSSQLNLIKIDIAEKNLQQAQVSIDDLLTKYPENAKVMLEMSRLESALGHVDDSLQWAEKAFSLDNSSLESALYLAGLYVELGTLELAENVARKGVQSHPEEMSMLSVLGQIQALKNQPKAAQVTFKHMAKIAGFDAKALYKIAHLQLRINEVSDARYSLRKAIQAEQNYYPAEVLQVELSIKLGMLDGAEKEARELQEKYSDNPVGFRLLGDVFMARELYGKADAQYIQGLELKPVGALVRSRYKALQALGKKAESGEVLSQWLQSHPQDSNIKQAYSEYLIASQDYKQAAISLVQLLDGFPDDALLLNNMAYVLYKLNRPEALDYAKRAYEKAANVPQVADTLGWLLVESGSAEEGLKFLREANSRESNSPEILYHLSVALNDTGRAKEAAVYLDRALLFGEEFEGKRQAVLLREELKKSTE
jgi:putative PEP-CTERM system TPR-repeat lipoprotein